MNVRDSEVICGLLQKAGYKITEDEQKADAVIFNTCSVRQHAEDKVWSAVGRCKVGIIGISGCMANNYREAIFEKAPRVDFVVGTRDIAKIPAILKEIERHKGNPLLEKKIYETDAELREDEIYHTGFHLDDKHAFVVISEGCENYCAYCVVPYVRGTLHFRDHQDILKEIKEDIAKGISKITLLGQNVNAYKYKDNDFIGLVQLVNSVKGLKEFGFITSHPKDTSLELFKALAECKKFNKYLHLPVQSGSDRILKLMNRGYTREFYLNLAASYRRIIKDGTLSTDIIIGFPSETEKDFQDTYNLVNDIQFDKAYIFKYSVRPNTKAAEFTDDVEKAEKERRHKLILDLQKSISRKKNAKKNN
ncbi:MAG: MiaB/RimO family radical SAM methylthiotransferase [Candidatus Omnitrophica bacterium]|nr:MiaB/RimO family radical SAM methylthiotransferase [Candidatus Omnitrophota bacterium]MDD5610780.1 MiaB/RimO family radical SAM methylthiotransferase [Candidatus Omnitrophota bacterium]